MPIRIRIRADTEADPYLLARLVGICARRCFFVEELHFDRTSKELVLVASGPEEHRARLRDWLGRHVHAEVRED